jgi:hypothetical protein
LTTSRFARIPQEVLSDQSLSLESKIVYAALAFYVFDGNIACTGQRALAQLTGINRRSIRRSLIALARAGHISISTVLSKGRHIYQLNSHIFQRLISSEVAKSDAFLRKAKLISFPKAK